MRPQLPGRKDFDQTAEDEQGGEACWVTLNQCSFIYIRHQPGNFNINGCTAALWIFVDLIYQWGSKREGECESSLLMTHGSFLSCIIKGQQFVQLLNYFGNRFPGISIALLLPHRLSKMIIALVSLDPSLSQTDRTKDWLWSKWQGSKSIGFEPKP